MTRYQEEKSGKLKGRMSTPENKRFGGGNLMAHEYGEGKQSKHILNLKKSSAIRKALDNKKK